MLNTRGLAPLAQINHSLLAWVFWLTYLVAWSAVLSGVAVVWGGADGRVVALLPQWLPLHHDPGTPLLPRAAKPVNEGNRSGYLCVDHA